MIRPIKFRGTVISRKAAVGREADIGDIVTGSLIIEDDGFTQSYWIRHKKKDYAAIDYPVDPDSVAQLVGYDKDGNEVYEGDIIIDENDEEMPAMLLAIQFNGKLKEATK